MTRLIKYFLITILLISCGSDPKSIYQDDLTKKFNSIIPNLLNNKGVPGVAVAIIDYGEIKWSGFYGYSNLKSKEPITTRTKFNIGSVSKTYSAWGVMKLVEDSLINLDKPVDIYLKRWHLPKSGFDNNKVTVRTLLNHTSGLSEYPMSESINGYKTGEQMPTISEALAQSHGSFGYLHVIREPGLLFEYNNGNYAIIQLLIEDVTNEPFPEYMERHIFKPLSLNNTGYSGDKFVATPYNEKNQSYDQIDFVEKASGGIFTTIHDFALFISTLDSTSTAPPGRKVLKPETLKEMIEPSPETKNEYGLGYQLSGLKKDGYFISHQGANEGFRSLFLFDKSKRSGLVILSNSDIGTHVFAEIICIWADWIKIKLEYPCPDIN